ncbi:hypothetical protein ABZW30_45425 [Kitasatospora sp. NPDC004669]|uniref:hypothetical protein n=1 Tax=Kitasatospora sp. NPDC004669 TaxID=3154555 RepID=UPI0033A22C70
MCPSNWRTMIRLPSLPFLGWIPMEQLLPVGFMFALGALAELYRTKLPINDLAGVAAFALFLASCRYGAFTVVGLPAFAYGLIWLAARMPGPLTKVGTKVDCPTASTSTRSRSSSA